MFGIVKACRHVLDDELHREWMAHLCGVCLTLRDDHGQAWRVATNVDAVALAVLTDALAATNMRRTAAPCPLRGMRRADVIAPHAPAMQHATAVSLLMAGTKLADHADDGDGAARHAPQLARRIARRVTDAGCDASARAGFDPGPLLAAVEAGAETEAATAPVAAGRGGFADASHATATAAGIAFAHVADLAERPDCRAPLTAAGDAFGRITLLLDAVADLDDDHAAGRPNPLDADGADDAARRRAARGIFRREHRRLTEAIDQLGLDPATPTARLAVALYGPVLARNAHKILGHDVSGDRSGSPAARQQGGTARRTTAGRTHVGVRRAVAVLAAYGIAAAFNPDGAAGPHLPPEEPTGRLRDEVANAAAADPGGCSICACDCCSDACCSCGDGGCDACDCCSCD